MKGVKGAELVELFPKQSSLDGKQFGNLVKLPLGYHKKACKWSVMRLENIRPCCLDVSKLRLPASESVDVPRVDLERPRLDSYVGKDPNCILKIKKGIKEGSRDNAGIVYASYLMNFRRLLPTRGFYLFRLWNARNKPMLSNAELKLIFNQAVKGSYVFGCFHELVRAYCDPEGCVFA